MSETIVHTFINDKGERVALIKYEKKKGRPPQYHTEEEKEKHYAIVVRKFIIRIKISF